MHAATVEILIEKAKFQPEIAVGIAEAIDVAIGGADLVTVPVLDTRFAAFETKMDGRFAELKGEIAQLRNELYKTKAELVRWVFLVILGNVALTMAGTALLNAVQRGH